jgi:Tol biopolymer transport system component
MNADGSDERPLIRGGRPGVVDPEWAPDGRSQLFMYGYYTQFDLYLASPDGRIIRRLTRTSLSEEIGEWSPDGRRIVYQSAGHLFILTVKGGRTLRLGNGWAPSWGVPTHG